MLFRTLSINSILRNNIKHTCKTAGIVFCDFILAINDKVVKIEQSHTRIVQQRIKKLLFALPFILYIYINNTNTNNIHHTR
nr:MAG TPA: hypothetical protein [Caudoviricetes sp.]